MHKPGREKTAFITHCVIFSYKFMHFELKNAKATYQRMITKMFEPLMGKTMDAYIDDMVVKSKKELDHLNDIAKVFKILKEHKLRLNAATCTFGCSSSKLLGHLVTQRGIGGSRLWQQMTLSS